MQEVQEEEEDVGEGERKMQGQSCAAAPDSKNWERGKQNIFAHRCSVQISLCARYFLCVKL